MNIWEKEIHVYFILSRFAEDEGAGWGGGLVVAACCRTTRGFPFKRIIDESTYEIQRCLPTWERWKISSKISTERSTLWRNFNSNHPFTRDNCIIFSPPPSFQKNQLTSEGCKEGRCRRRKFVVSFFPSIRIFVSAFRRSYR